MCYISKKLNSLCLLDKLLLQISNAYIVNHNLYGNAHRNSISTLASAIERGAMFANKENKSNYRSIMNK